MENASKALLIAGAILLSILIIAIGMYIYNSSQNSIQTAGSQINSTEIKSFNQTWEMYEGTQTGANVRSLISSMSANAKSNENEATRLPNLYYEATASEADGSGETVVSNIADKNVKGFNTARTSIEARHTYNVTLVQSDATTLVSGIIITYNPDFDATSLQAYDDFATDD